MENLMKNGVAGFAGFSRNLLSGVAAIALLTPAAVLAQDAPVDNSAADGDEFTGDEEFSSGNQIIVTATKREQTLQEIPVAVSVTTAETLEREQIRDLKDLQTVVPSLRVTQLQSAVNTNFIIRGFGNGANNAGIEPSVGVFVDGVYRSRTAASISDLPNVSRIEVLRGPQSTLFGKNASAGVISMVTSEPSFTPEGSVELSYGNYDADGRQGLCVWPDQRFHSRSALLAASTSAMVTIPMRPLVAPPMTATAILCAARALFDNGENFKFRLIADYDRFDENCCGVVNLQPSDFTQALQAIGGQVNAPDDRFDNVVFNNFPSTNDVENYGVSGQFDYDLNDTISL